MHDLFVTQNEIGIIDDRNRGDYRQIITYGASPCVIVTVSANGTCLLAHVHEDSDLRDFEKKLRAAFPPQPLETRYEVGLFGQVPTHPGLRLSHSSLREELRAILIRLFRAVTDEDRVYSGRRMRAEDGRTYALTDGAALMHGELTLASAFHEEQQMALRRALGQKTPMSIRTAHSDEELRQNDPQGDVAEILWNDRAID